MDKTLAELRTEIRALDDEILQLMAKRQDVARAVGRVKLAQHLPVKDFKVEKEVVDRARRRAREIGLYADQAAETAALLIKYAVAVQDEFHTQSRKERSRDQKRILVVGGFGRMGMWLADFFDSFGHHVACCDHGAPPPSHAYPVERELVAVASRFDVIVLATPISATADVLTALQGTKTQALIFDLCSLKTPILAAIGQARKSGLRVTSVHPMFGPDVDLLSGRNILFCDTGEAALVAEARALFADTTATLITIPLAEHDKLMGYVLGLSHLTNLVFARVLMASGSSMAGLREVASTTFNAQLQVTEPVVAENRDLYFEIQAENSFTPDLVAAIGHELGRYGEAIAAKDRDLFCQLMEESRAFLQPD